MYITTRVVGKTEDQDVFLSLLLGKDPKQMTKGAELLYGSASTRTITASHVPQELENIFDAEDAEKAIDQALVYAQEKLKGHASGWYKHYSIPKRSGGERRIDEPLTELRTYTAILEDILRTKFYALYHTSAYAYVRNRGTLDCIKQHQRSNWFLKTDFHDFFGSTTLDETINVLKTIWPFSVYCTNAERWAKLTKAISYVFLNGGLPQGSTISPMLTNLVMIPFDNAMNVLMTRRSITYTRYADDCLFSSKFPFETKEILYQVKHAIHRLGYPYRMNYKKLRYGSIKGRNWNLGLMLNASHQITIGHQAKREFKADLFRLMKDYQKREFSDQWMMEFVGRYHYYEYIEPEFVKTIFNRMRWKTRRHWQKDIDQFVAMRNQIVRMNWYTN